MTSLLDVKVKDKVSFVFGIRDFTYLMEWERVKFKKRVKGNQLTLLLLTGYDFYTVIIKLL